MKKVLLISFLLVMAQFAFAQKEICGNVTDKTSGEPIIGVTVLLKGTTNGTTTDIKGKYCLEVAEDVKSGELTFSYIGYTTQSVKINNKKTIHAALEESTVALEEVVIANYGAKSSKKKRKGASSESRGASLSPASRYETSKTSSVPPPPPPPSSVAPPPAYDLAIPSSTKDAILSKPKPVFIDSDAFEEYDEAAPAPDASEFMMMSIDGDYEVAEAEYRSTQTEVRAGLLTAGEINDFSKWKMWNDITTDALKSYQQQWEFFTSNRYTVQLSTETGKPIVDAEVKLLEGKNTLHWSSKTDNTGKAELWLQLFDNTAATTSNQLRIEVQHQRKKQILKAPKQFKEGINFMILKTKCDMPQRADILFVVDATSSMGDEIDYLKAELKDVIKQVQDKRKDLDINLGSVFYRDYGDEYVTKKSDFSTRIDQTIQFIQNNRAAGGGDYEEAVEAALDLGVNKMNWSEKAVARLLFLVLDAPPHETPEIKNKLQTLSQQAAQKGIRIIPVAASGTNKSTEYLMRVLALASNGTYTFLTDHSGIGGGHIEPSTDDYDMEFLNELLVRVIDQFTQMPDCDASTIVDAQKTEPIEEEILKVLNFYPNPVEHQLTIEIKQAVDELFITDFSGKILQRLEKLEEGKTTVDMGEYPSGMYFVRYLDSQGKEGSAKLIVI